jgi:ATP-dependent exoDNAse (exonuclease V) beta subunit
VLDEARWWFEQTGGSLGEYLRWVALRVDNDDRSNVTTDETDDDAVHVLTIHAAKGLEFPVVIAAGLGRQRPGGDLVRARFRSEADGALAVSVKVGTLSTLDWDSSGDRVQAELEAARLAYVACTRAEDHVVVCLHRVSGRSGNSAGEMDVHLDDTHRSPLQLVEPAQSAPPDVVELDPRVDRPEARPVEWQVRSSWSATSLRQRDDDAPTAVIEAFDPIAAGDSEPADWPVPDDVGPLPPDDVPSVHAKHPRAFASLPDQIGRYGTRIGRAVHAVLQVVDLADPHEGLDELVDRHCLSEAVPDRFRPYVARLVASVLSSEVFARLRQASAAGTVRREMYVGAEVVSSGSAPMGVYGIIDAVWMEDHGFVVVDFKTDHVLEPAEVLIDRYRLQLQAYEQALVAATGRPVAELLLCVALPDGSPAATIAIPTLSQPVTISG